MNKKMKRAIPKEKLLLVSVCVVFKDGTCYSVPAVAETEMAAIDDVVVSLVSPYISISAVQCGVVRWDRMMEEFIIEMNPIFKR
jgi:hypothetical protein